MIFYTYILYSSRIDHYYIGHTGDSITERLRKHNTNHKGYTGKTNDWVVVFMETYENKTEAYARERQIRKQKSRIYIENLIKSAEI